MPQIKILFVSIGSLVGTTFLELLAHPEYSRRHQVYLIGINSLAETPNNFMCDQFYLAPEIRKKENFISFLLTCIEKEDPDLILAGRDEDNLILAELKEQDARLQAKIPLGSVESALLAVDKSQTYQFCSQYKLPIPESLCIAETSLDECLLFCEQVCYPLIAKPVKGFASKGVYLLRNEQDLKKLYKHKDLLLQKYIGQQSELQSYLKKFDSVPPLFLGLESSSHYTAQTIISPQGEYMPIFISHNQHEMGKSVFVEPVQMPDIERLSQDVVHAFVQKGGAGNIGIQWRSDTAGRWYIQEFNLRFNANSLIRLESGLDELGCVCDYFLGPTLFPNLSRRPYAYDKVFMKQVHSRAILKQDLNDLKQDLYWSSH